MSYRERALLVGYIVAAEMQLLQVRLLLGPRVCPGMYGRLLVQEPHVRSRRDVVVIPQAEVKWGQVATLFHHMMCTRRQRFPCVIQNTCIVNCVEIHKGLHRMLRLRLRISDEGAKADLTLTNIAMIQVNLQLEFTQHILQKNTYSFEQRLKRTTIQV